MENCLKKHSKNLKIKETLISHSANQTNSMNSSVVQGRSMTFWVPNFALQFAVSGYYELSFSTLWIAVYDAKLGSKV